MSKVTQSGRITCTVTGVEYEWPGGRWSLAFEDIAAVGECTNELGPFADDYFICFVHRDGLRWSECSFYAEGRDELLVHLAQHFGTSFEYGLCNSTTFRSRVMWPPSLCEEPLFEYHEPVAGNRFSAWLRTIGLKPGTNVQTVASTVRQFVSVAAG